MRTTLALGCLVALAAGVRFVQTAPSEQTLAATEPVAGTVDWTERRATFTTHSEHRHYEFSGTNLVLKRIT